MSKPGALSNERMALSNVHGVTRVRCPDMQAISLAQALGVNNRQTGTASRMIAEALAFFSVLDIVAPQDSFSDPSSLEQFAEYYIGVQYVVLVFDSVLFTIAFKKVLVVPKKQ